MNNYTVYAHKNNINGKVYAGITMQKPASRWRNGKGYTTLRFKRAIKKYGWDNFEHIIIAEKLTKLEATEMEKAIIKAFDLTNPKKGYNSAIGGDGGGMYHKHQTEETRTKISKARKIIGFSEEHKKHISEAKAGAKHHFAKKVYQYTKDGIFIKEWAYMSEASEVLKIKKPSISECCKGKRKSAGGYKWTYRKE